MKIKSVDVTFTGSSSKLKPKKLFASVRQGFKLLGQQITDTFEYGFNKSGKNKVRIVTESIPYGYIEKEVVDLKDGTQLILSSTCYKLDMSKYEKCQKRH